jgi:hypothetical protein
MSERDSNPAMRARAALKSPPRWVRAHRSGKQNAPAYAVAAEHGRLHASATCRTERRRAH